MKPLPHHSRLLGKFLPFQTLILVFTLHGLSIDFKFITFRNGLELIFELTVFFFFFYRNGMILLMSAYVNHRIFTIFFGVINRQ